MFSTVLSALSEGGTLSGIALWIEVVSLIVEIIAVVIIVFAVFYETIVFLRRLFRRELSVQQRFREYKHGLGRALLLSLEILVAADIVRTVALEPTINSVVVLGILVLIRTFLSWSLVVEVEGRLPWRSRLREHTARLADGSENEG
jgi:uncharacterized membrane protein